MTHAHTHDHAHPHTHGPGHVCDHGSLADHDPASDIICLDSVSYTYPAEGLRDADSRRPALRDVTLHVERGCNLGIIGPNGAGKSTLLRIVLGLIDDYEGTVEVEGVPPREATRRGDVIGYVPQRHDVAWRMPVSAKQVVRMGLVGKAGLFRRVNREDLAYADTMLDRVGMAPLANRPIADLSGGQQQRVFIARALAARPRILILDEPTVGIDEAGQEQFAQLIHDLHESLNLTVLIVSHDLQAIARGCNRVAVLNQRLHYHDAPSGLTQDVLDEVFRHDLAPSTHG